MTAAFRAAYSGALALDDFRALSAALRPVAGPPLERLTAHLGGAQLWAKRDDCNSGLAFGGNKTRKLEYLVADALAQGCDTLVSIGGVQSNHTRQVAAVAARARPRVRARPGVLGRLAGRRLRPRRQHPAQPPHGRRRAARAGRLRDRLQGELGAGAAPTSRPPAASRTPIPAGASDHPLGGLGFAGWAHEVAEQEARARRLLRHRDRLLGDRLDAGRHGRRLRRLRSGARRVIGIDGSAKPAETHDAGDADRAGSTAELIGVGASSRRTR